MVFVLGVKNATRGMSVSKTHSEIITFGPKPMKTKRKSQLFYKKYARCPLGGAKPVFVLGAKNATRGMSVSKTHSETTTFAPKPMKTK